VTAGGHRAGIGVAAAALLLAGCASGAAQRTVAITASPSPASPSPSPSPSDTAGATSRPSASSAPAATPSPTATGTPPPSARPTATTPPAPGATTTAAPPAPAPSPPPPSPSPSPSPEPPPPEPSPTPTAPRYVPPDQPFASTVSEIVGTPVEDRMVGVSWREGCPVPLEQLRYVTVSHVGLDGAVHTGELVVRADVVQPVLTALQRMYEIGFPIERMRLVSDYGADDDASMRADNTSAFNCRTVAGTSRWSNHAYGAAIDVNPLRNPYVRGGTVDPPEGAAYADRANHRPGMLVDGTAEVAAWTDLGWDWGGTWSSGQDYQHFSASGG
jgi:hypothetical protein